jgi:hypothetical protein
MPLLAWMTYVRVRFGPAEDPGLGNFTLPFAGFIEKVRFVGRDLASPEATPLSWATLAVVVALAVQWGFFAFRWRPGERWWRIGAMFALMMVFLATPVWEGYPGASTRVLLPMTLAFNLLVPPRWPLAAGVAGGQPDRGGGGFRVFAAVRVLLRVGRSAGAVGGAGGAGARLARAGSAQGQPVALDVGRCGIAAGE